MRILLTNITLASRSGTEVNVRDFALGLLRRGHRPVLAFVSMLLGNLLCLVLGAAWLASIIGVEAAFTSGVAPFIIGGVLKSVLGAAVLALLARGKVRAAQ